MAALPSDSKDFCGDGGHCASLSTSDFTGDAIRFQRFRHTERRQRRSESRGHSSLSQRKSSFFAERPPAEFCAPSVWHCIIWGPFFMCGKELCLLSQRFRQPAHRSLNIAGPDMILHSLFIFSLVKQSPLRPPQPQIWRVWTCFCGMSPPAPPLSVRLKSWSSTLTARGPQSTQTKVIFRGMLKTCPISNPKCHPTRYPSSKEIVLSLIP